MDSILYIVGTWGPSASAPSMWKLSSPVYEVPVVVPATPDRHKLLPAHPNLQRSMLIALFCDDGHLQPCSPPAAYCVEQGWRQHSQWSNAHRCGVEGQQSRQQAAGIVVVVVLLLQIVSTWQMINTGRPAHVQAQARKCAGQQQQGTVRIRISQLSWLAAV